MEGLWRSLQLYVIRVCFFNFSSRVAVGSKTIKTGAYSDRHCVNTAFAIIQLYSGGQVYWWEKPKLPQNYESVASHIRSYWEHLVMSCDRTHNFSGDLVSSCQPNYHTFTAITAVRTFEYIKKQTICRFNR